MIRDAHTSLGTMNEKTMIVSNNDVLLKFKLQVDYTYAKNIL